MTPGPQIAWLPDGRRLHMNHGPIDLIVEAWGEPGEVARAYGQAADRFRTILAELAAELPELRRPAGSIPRPFKGPTAWRMERAVSEEVGNGSGPIGRGYCSACFSGSYPIRLEEWWLSEDRIKLAFEGTLPG